MTKTFLALILASLFVTTVHADEVSDYIDANVLWGDDAEFQEFNRVDVAQADVQHANVPQVDDDWINANMLWADDAEFQAH